MKKLAFRTSYCLTNILAHHTIGATNVFEGSFATNAVYNLRAQYCVDRLMCTSSHKVKITVLLLCNRFDIDDDVEEITNFVEESLRFSDNYE